MTMFPNEVRSVNKNSHSKLKEVYYCKLGQQIMLPNEFDRKETRQITAV